MSQDQALPYQARKISVVAKGTDVLVREYVLGPGEFIPWHHHTQVTDNYHNLEGVVLIETRAPAARRELNPGESATVTPPTAHHVSKSSGKPCRFLLVQGVGKYDFVTIVLASVRYWIRCIRTFDEIGSRRVPGRHESA